MILVAKSIGFKMTKTLRQIDIDLLIDVCSQQFNYKNFFWDCY